MDFFFFAFVVVLSMPIGIAMLPVSSGTHLGHMRPGYMRHKSKTQGTNSPLSFLASEVPAFFSTLLRAFLYLFYILYPEYLVLLNRRNRRMHIYSIVLEVAFESLQRILKQ